MTCHCPHIRYHECDEYGQLSWNALIKYPLPEHWCHITRHIEIATPDQALDTTKETKKEETYPDHSLAIMDIAAPATVTLQRPLQIATKRWAKPL